MKCKYNGKIYPIVYTKEQCNKAREDVRKEFQVCINDGTPDIDMVMIDMFEDFKEILNIPDNDKSLKKSFYSHVPESEIEYM